MKSQISNLRFQRWKAGIVAGSEAASEISNLKFEISKGGDRRNVLLNAADMAAYGVPNTRHYSF
jgi:hypothetical protein